MGNLLLGAGLALALALLIAIHHKLDGLPPRLWAIAKRERAADEARALTALTEATAARVGTITLGLRHHEEHLAASVRAQIAEAETRARVVERRSSDAGVALHAATDLVRALRSLCEEMEALIACGHDAARARAAPALRDPPLDERPTMELSPRAPAEEGEEPAEELTTVADRPAIGGAWR